MSYSRLDAEDFALRLADQLAAGQPPYPVWLDRRELRPGQDWDAQIEQALAECRLVVFVMTRDSVDPLSGSKDEWVRALRDKKPVIPLRLHVDAELPYRLGSRQFIDFTASFDSGLAGLRSYLEWTSTAAGKLGELKIRLADVRRELSRADIDRRPMLEAEIADLTRRIKEQPECRTGLAVEAEGSAPAGAWIKPSAPLPASTAPVRSGQAITIGTVHGDNINVAGDYRRNG